MSRKNKVKVVLIKQSEKAVTLEKRVRALRDTKVDASFDDGDAGHQLLFWQAWLRKNELPVKDRAWLRETDDRYFRGTYVLAEEMAKRGIILYWANGVRCALPPKTPEEVKAILYRD